MSGRRDERLRIEGDPTDALGRLLASASDLPDPRAKEAALRRLRKAPEEQLAVFGDALREDALKAGASEQEIREAQTGHPEHGQDG